MPRAKSASIAATPKTALPANFYETADLDFGAFLEASRSLTFDHAELRGEKCVLVFRDPDGNGPEIFDDFCTQDIKLSVRLLLGSRNRLIERIRAVRETKREQRREAKRESL